MKTREEIRESYNKIVHDGKIPFEVLIEVLLDIRDLLDKRGSGGSAGTTKN